MTKDNKRRDGRRNSNKKRDDRSQDDGPMIVVRKPARLRALRVNNVIDFQGKPMIVRALVEGIDGVKISLSPALKEPVDDSDVKVGRAASSASYDAWYFTTRPISGMLIIDRFHLVPGKNPERGSVKRRKRAQASDRMAA